MSTILSGCDIDIYYKEEAGTFPDVADSEVFQYLGAVQTVPLGVSVERADIRGLGNCSRESKPELNREVTISFDVPLELTTNWVLLQDISDPTKYYTLALKTLIGATTNYIYITGARLDEVTVSTNRHEVIMVNFVFSVVDMDGVHASIQYIETYESRVVADPQVWHDGKIEKTIASGWTTTGDIEHAEGWSVTISHSMEKKGSWTGIVPRTIQNTKLDISGNITADVEDYLDLAEILAGNSGTLKFFVAAAKSIDVAGATYDSWDSDMSELSLIEQSMPFTGDTVILTDA